MNNPMFQPLTSPVSEEPIIPRNPAIERGTFSITNKNPNPEASIRWIDYFYSQEGYEFLNMGPEGELWEWEGEKKENYSMSLKAMIPGKISEPLFLRITGFRHQQRVVQSVD